MKKETLLHVYCGGKHYRFVSTLKDGTAMFGGPQERTVVGMPHGPHRLHQIAEISSSSIDPLADAYAFSLPLIYGFRFDGCALKYIFSSNEIDVLDIRPEESSDDWPYFDYPALLPYVPIETLDSTAATWDDFVGEFVNLPEEQPAQLVAVVEPLFSLGFSMWGKGGDVEGVTVVFECDLVRRTVVSYNMCS